jgi:hypothetical protein
MKNIHIISTDKPSRLFTWGNKLRLGDLVGCPDYFGKLNKNIYITSEEEIKEGDWFYAKYSSSKYPIYKCKNTKCYWELKESKIIGRKITLTTDQDLIKDGVQSIIDEFLEWFVNNPSCESVEIQDFPMTEKYNSKGEYIHRSYWIYKIIIPYEEPKQRLEKYSERFDNDESAIGNPETWGKRIIEEPKQETIEYDLLQHIKFCLECKNESQAIRLIEQYGFVKQEEKYEELETAISLLKQTTEYEVLDSWKKK